MTQIKRGTAHRKSRAPHCSHIYFMAQLLPSVMTPPAVSAPTAAKFWNSTPPMQYQHIRRGKSDQHDDEESFPIPGGGCRKASQFHTVNNFYINSATIALPLLSPRLQHHFHTIHARPTTTLLSLPLSIVPSATKVTKKLQHINFIWPSEGGGGT